LISSTGLASVEMILRYSCHPELVSGFQHAKRDQSEHQHARTPGLGRLRFTATAGQSTL